MTREMNRVQACAYAWAALLCVDASWSPAAEATKPNVVVILTDDQGYGDLSCHGNPVVKTPNLDRLRKESVRFIDFHVAPMCTPTRGQLLTGVDALRNGAMRVNSGRALLRRDLPTMPQLFAAAGYATGQFGKWHLGDNYPYRPQDRGFQETLWFPSSHIGSAADFWDNDCFDDTYWHNGRRAKFAGYCTDVFFGEAMRWMRKQVEVGKPFLCCIPTNVPHTPHFLPAEFRKAMEAEIARAGTPKGTAGLARYFGMIKSIDDNVGRLESFLRDSGLSDKTIVVFLTDNGSTMGPRYYNAGMRGGKTTLWEGGHRVPCFLRWPAGKLRAAGDVPGLAQAQDVLPTLLELCGVATPPGARFDGTCLAPVLRGKAEMPDRMLVVQYAEQDGMPAAKRGEACVMWRRWRLVRDEELYNLDDDPAQARNVAADHPDVVAKLRAHYKKWWEGVAPQLDVPERVIVGDPAENPSMLTPCEWRDVGFDRGRDVRAGLRKNGVWHLEVAAAGDFQFELRRWPRERDAAIPAGIPAVKHSDGEFPAGVALPIAKTRMKIGDFDESWAVAATDKTATFRVKLPAGRTELQTWFNDAAGKEICGAYYVYVTKLP